MRCGEKQVGASPESEGVRRQLKRILRGVILGSLLLQSAPLRAQPSEDPAALEVVEPATQARPAQASEAPPPAETAEPAAPAAPPASAEPPAKAPEPVAKAPEADALTLRVGGETEAQQHAREEADHDDEIRVGSALGDPWGDPDSLSVISLRALMQTLYSTTFASKSEAERISYRVREDSLAEKGDGWELRRLLVRLSSDPSVYFGFKAVLDFAELVSNDPEDVVKQAYTTLRPIPGRLEFVVGLFKIPFAIFELDPSSRFELAEYGPANRLLNDIDFSGRDLGVQVMVAPLKKAKRLRLMAGVFRGHTYDEHDFPAGTVAARVELRPKKWLRIGGGWVEHTRSVRYKRPFNTSDKDVVPNPIDPLYPAEKRWDAGRAYGADLRIKKKRVMLRGEFLYGDRVDVHTRYDARTFWDAWGLLAYRIDLPGTLKLLPAVRAEWFDADREHRSGMHRLLSAGITLLFLDRARFLIDVTRTDVSNNTPVLNQPKPIQTDPYLALDNTRLSFQLQVEL